MDDRDIDDEDTTLIFLRRTAEPSVSTLKERGRVAETTSGSLQPSGLWDAADVARYLKVSRSWVYHRAEAGLIPTVRLGGLLRFDPKAIRDLAKGQVRAGGAKLGSSTAKG